MNQNINSDNKHPKFTALIFYNLATIDLSYIIKEIPFTIKVITKIHQA